MARQIKKTLKPDTKGRITLGELAEGISSFKVTMDKNHRIILEPFVEIPALKQVQQGVDDAKKGKVRKRGSFSKYKDEELDE